MPRPAGRTCKQASDSADACQSPHAYLSSSATVRGPDARRCRHNLSGTDERRDPETASNLSKKQHADLRQRAICPYPPRSWRSPNIKTVTVGAASCATNGNGHDFSKLALALDNSGSMAESAGGHQQDVGLADGDPAARRYPQPEGARRARPRRSPSCRFTSVVKRRDRKKQRGPPFMDYGRVRPRSTGQNFPSAAPELPCTLLSQGRSSISSRP